MWWCNECQHEWVGFKSWEGLEEHKLNTHVGEPTPKKHTGPGKDDLDKEMSHVEGVPMDSNEESEDLEVRAQTNKRAKDSRSTTL